MGREPNEVEWSIIDAEWSEHSSYKSSKALLRLFPTKGKRVVLGPGYDAGVVDVGDGYVVTLHIESHNHPSAVDPYGGAVDRDRRRAAATYSRWARGPSPWSTSSGSGG